MEATCDFPDATRDFVGKASSLNQPVSDVIFDQALLFPKFLTARN
jgi:hypothetical protein